MVGTFVRALCIFALALIVGLGHRALRDTPISFAKRTAPSLPPELSAPSPGGETKGTDADAQASGGDGQPAGAADPAANGAGQGQSGTDPDADPAAGLDSVLDAAVNEGQITLREAIALYRDFGAIFLDARHEEEYDAGHVLGAYWMSASRVGTAASFEVIDLLDPSMPIVIYCTGGDCDASENTRRRLELLNIPIGDIYILGKGYEDWANAGLPIEGLEVEGGQSGAFPADGANDPAGG